MKKYYVGGAVLLSLGLVSGCVSLSHHERDQLAELRAEGITVDRPAGRYEAPNKLWVAGVLNILPGFGNFYLGTGEGSDSVQWVFGACNLLFWPLSVVWGVPQAIIDANTLNQRDMIYYYNYSKYGKRELQNWKEQNKSVFTE